jgi:membrane-bound serine protease (ClpP class)
MTAGRADTNRETGPSTTDAVAAHGHAPRVWRARACWTTLLLIVIASVLLPLQRSGAAQPPAPRGIATVIELDGAISPATSNYVRSAMAGADAQHAAVIVLQMDTPGGLDTAMREIIKAILASPIPVVGYVAPSGARAASAGTYILYACHLAAMAPATNLGAATPISIGGNEAPSPVPASPTQPAPAEPNAPQPSSAPGTHAPERHGSPAPAAVPVPATAEERKVVNDAVAYIRSLAQLRGRNAEWAESAVRGAASLPARDALAQHVINLIADDVPDLLAQIDGRTVQLEEHPVALHTRELTIQRVTPDWRARLLMFVSHPTVAYGLLLAGIWGLLLEGYHPGGVLPGVVGALALLLALYGLELLAVNFAGLALIALGIGLIITEFFMPTYGSLGVGGLAAFVIGSIILFANNQAGLQVALPLIAGVAIAGGIVILAIVSLAARARRRPVTTGAEAMIGESVEIVSAAPDHLVVRYGGELWNAHPAAGRSAVSGGTLLTPGHYARIVRVSGLTLWIEPLVDASATGAASAPGASDVPLK